MIMLTCSCMGVFTTSAPQPKLTQTDDRSDANNALVTTKVYMNTYYIRTYITTILCAIPCTRHRIYRRRNNNIFNIIIKRTLGRHQPAIGDDIIITRYYCVPYGARYVTCSSHNNSCSLRFPRKTFFLRL